MALTLTDPPLVQQGRSTVATGADVSRVQAAVQAAGWGGVALARTQVLGVTCYPVVEFTDATARRMAAGDPPVLLLSTLAIWESWDGGMPGSPPAPLRLVGFASTARWSRALRAARSLAGAGSSMVIGQQRSTVALLEADLAGVWVVGPDRTQQMRVRVPGRVGPVITSMRVTATRYIEELLFGHALLTGVLS